MADSYRIIRLAPIAPKPQRELTVERKQTARNFIKRWTSVGIDFGERAGIGIKTTKLACLGRRKQTPVWAMDDRLLRPLVVASFFNLYFNQPNRLSIQQCFLLALGGDCLHRVAAYNLVHTGSTRLLPISQYKRSFREYLALALVPNPKTVLNLGDVPVHNGAHPQLFTALIAHRNQQFNVGHLSSPLEAPGQPF
jgi:hypothetical protein